MGVKRVCIVVQAPLYPSDLYPAIVFLAVVLTLAALAVMRGWLGSPYAVV